MVEDTGESDGEVQKDKSIFAGAQIPATPSLEDVCLCCVVVTVIMNCDDIVLLCYSVVCCMLLFLLYL